MWHVVNSGWLVPCRYLGSLTTLALAGNPLRSFEAIHGVSRLPQLQDLSFDDSVFQGCPVTRAEGYRAFVLCSMMHLEVSRLVYRCSIRRSIRRRSQAG